MVKHGSPACSGASEDCYDTLAPSVPSEKLFPDLHSKKSTRSRTARVRLARRIRKQGLYPNQDGLLVRQQDGQTSCGDKGRNSRPITRRNRSLKIDPDSQQHAAIPSVVMETGEKAAAIRFPAEFQDQLERSARHP